jgi:hypothetical protein
MKTVPMISPPSSFALNPYLCPLFPVQRPSLPRLLPGILFFGTPRYSSSSLLPADPSAFSRPGLTKLACRTAYTPDSFQLPDGTWSWASEWMVNMRRDGETDEKGWEYNSYFHQKGWHSRLRWHGWKGWVRRREW